MLQDGRVIEELKGVFGDGAMSVEDQYAVPSTRQLYGREQW